MADLSAVLRKTIDGLPGATPQLRAKVYEKARAAIARQIASASPPLSEETVEARRFALEDAIAATESHYAAADEAAGREPSPAPEAAPPKSDPADRAASSAAATVVSPAPRREAGGIDAGSKVPGASQRPLGAKDVGAVAADERGRREPGPIGSAVPPRVSLPPRLPGEIKPGASGAASMPPAGSDASGGRDGPSAGSAAAPAVGRSEPLGSREAGSIPAADVTAPRSAGGSRPSAPHRRRGAVLAGLALLLLGGAGAAGYVYLDDIRTLLNVDGGGAIASRPEVGTPVAATDTAPPTSPPPPDTTVAALPTPPASPPLPDPGLAPAAPVPPVLTPGAPAAAVPPPPAPPAEAAPAPGAPGSKRRFTQRLLPDGSEVDEGPGAGSPNAFGEGTNVAAASPETLNGASAMLPATPAVTPAEVAALPPADVAAPPPDAGTVPPAAAASTPPAPPAPVPPVETAALQPDRVEPAAPAVGQKAFFYEERSETEPGTQGAGNVVWSVVNEAPVEGAPAEPAIRAVADVPNENLRLTMTIRRNADATLPASHVIELMFDTPPDFPGGSIANVQRLALKPTEKARGEPLIGVAGKISDGFFIIALNNLDEATRTNLGLMGKEQWIDIPLAYATGRRALMSIEKGIPGERVFKEAMDAWAAKT